MSAAYPSSIGHRSGIEPATRLWIVNGLLWFCLCIYAWGRWIFGPYFVQNTLGRELAPEWNMLLARTIEVFSVAVMFFVLYVFVIRPKIKTGRMSFDGLFFLGVWMMYIQEPWINWTSLQFLYSTVFINFGSWCGYIPGWSSPNPEKIPVATIAWGCGYVWTVGIPAWTGSKLMSWLKAKHPGISFLQTLGFTYLAFIIFTLVLEGACLQMELFSYGAVVPELTMFAGTKHQFPIYEVLSWSATYLGLACIHHFRDDQGHSFVERGIDRLRLPARLTTFARFLAIMGGIQLSMLLTYNLPYQFWALHAGPLLPAYEEYRTAGVCGPKTAYDCPDPRLPIARRSSPTNRINAKPEAVPASVSPSH